MVLFHNFAFNFPFISETSCCNSSTNLWKYGLLILRNSMTEVFEMHLSSCIAGSIVSSVPLCALCLHVALIVFLVIYSEN